MNRILQRQTPLKHNGEFAENQAPIWNGHSPLLGSLLSCKEQCFQKSGVIGKYRTLTIQLTISRIETFNRVGSINYRPQSRREFENGNNRVPIRPPRFHEPMKKSL